MHTSTTPVREAMRELAAEGLLRVDPHKGVVVREPRLEELLEIYEIRNVLEPLSVAKVAQRMTPEELDKAAAMLKQMERTKDPAIWSALNRDFHAFLNELSGNATLAAVLNNLGNLSAMYVAVSLRTSPQRIASGNLEHRAILDACRARDAKLTSEAIRKHLQSTVERVRVYLHERRDGHGEGDRR